MKMKTKVRLGVRVVYQGPFPGTIEDTIMYSVEVNVLSLPQDMEKIKERIMADLPITENDIVIVQPMFVCPLLGGERELPEIKEEP
jgi:hypothetical protein